VTPEARGANNLQFRSPEFTDFKPIQNEKIQESRAQEEIRKRNPASNSVIRLQPFREVRISQLRLVVSYGNSEGLLGTD